MPVVATRAVNVGSWPIKVGKRMWNKIEENVRTCGGKTKKLFPLTTCKRFWVVFSVLQGQEGPGGIPGPRGPKVVWEMSSYSREEDDVMWLSVFCTVAFCVWIFLGNALTVSVFATCVWGCSKCLHVGESGTNGSTRSTGSNQGVLHWRSCTKGKLGSRVLIDE